MLFATKNQSHGLVAKWPFCTNVKSHNDETRIGPRSTCLQDIEQAKATSKSLSTLNNYNIFAKLMIYALNLQIRLLLVVPTQANDIDYKSMLQKSFMNRSSKLQNHVLDILVDNVLGACQTPWH